MLELLQFLLQLGEVLGVEPGRGERLSVNENMETQSKSENKMSECCMETQNKSENQRSD